MARHLVEESDEKNLCLGGGLALNPALNSAVVEGSGATDVYLLPVGGDAGTAIGGALAFEADPDWHLGDAYWGSFPTSEEIDHALLAAGLEPSMVGAGVVPKTAELLAGGAIGGWFRGRSEMGPRALGHRSILADPGSLDSRIRLNKLIKRRETFQPFAPSVLLDACEALFPGLGPSPFMLRTWPVGEEFRARIPAVIHDDGTARVQTIVDGDGSGLAELLQAFAGHAGLPVLLNTSLNRRGEPLAERPEDAVAVFQETGLDFLVMEDVLIERNNHAG
jgi:carbamoyltransferase